MPDTEYSYYVYVELANSNDVAKYNTKYWGNMTARPLTNGDWTGISAPGGGVSTGEDKVFVAGKNMDYLDENDVNYPSFYIP